MSTSTSTGSWLSEEGPVEVLVSIEVPGTPSRPEDSDLEEFPRRNFQSKLMEADLDWLQHWY